MWGEKGERRRERKRREEQPEQLEMCGRAEIAAVGTTEQSLRLVVFQRIFARTGRQKRRGGGGGDRARIATATWVFFQGRKQPGFFLLAQRKASFHRPRFHAVKIARRFLLSHSVAFATSRIPKYSDDTLMYPKETLFPTGTDCGGLCWPGGRF